MFAAIIVVHNVRIRHFYRNYQDKIENLANAFNKHVIDSINILTSVVSPNLPGVRINTMFDFTSSCIP